MLQHSEATLQSSKSGATTYRAKVLHKVLNFLLIHMFNHTSLYNINEMSIMVSITGSGTMQCTKGRLITRKLEHLLLDKVAFVECLDAGDKMQKRLLHRSSKIILLSVNFGKIINYLNTNFRNKMNSSRKKRQKIGS